MIDDIATMDTIITEVETEINVSVYERKTKLLAQRLAEMQAIISVQDSSIQEQLRETITTLEELIKERMEFAESLKKEYLADSLSEKINIAMERKKNITP